MRALGFQEPFGVMESFSWPPASDHVDADDAAVVRRYIQLARDRAAAAGQVEESAALDHSCEVLLALARALTGGALAAHLDVLRHATIGLLRESGLRLCSEAESLRASPSGPDRGESDAIRELGCSLLKMQQRFKQGLIRPVGGMLGST
jgi:hypothetical protein